MSVSLTVLVEDEEIAGANGKPAFLFLNGSGIKEKFELILFDEFLLRFLLHF